jgi:3-deoxy-D-manno-octulosonic-acid transferase
MRRRLLKYITRNLLNVKGNNLLIVAPTRHLERVNSLECEDGN